jgi:YHS domain-containing protein
MRQKPSGRPSSSEHIIKDIKRKTRKQYGAEEEKFINPVCGMAVSTTDPAHQEEHEGVSFYFCCDNCWTTFQKDPAKYAAIHRHSIGSVPA